MSPHVTSGDACHPRTVCCSPARPPSAPRQGAVLSQAAHTAARCPKFPKPHAVRPRQPLGQQALSCCLGFDIGYAAYGGGGGRCTILQHVAQASEQGACFPNSEMKASSVLWCFGGFASPAPSESVTNRVLCVQGRALGPNLWTSLFRSVCWR